MESGNPGLEYRRAGQADVDALVDLRIEFMRIVKDAGLDDEPRWRRYWVLVSTTSMER